MQIRFLLSLALFVGALACPAAEPERSVVQIFTFSQSPDWAAPWRFEPVRRAGGSGFVIPGKRIMSNAHVVAWAKQIIVRRYQDPRQYIAKVEFVADDCDLALLSVEDERFFEGLPALEFGDLPKVRSTVVTYGYPAGGEEISYTRGVVSRIEMQSYAHIGNRQFLGVQTDAAINPGNSGGPVVQDDRVVGVAFQGIQGLENTGFFIPPPVIDHFLKDIKDGRYDGFPMAGVRMAELQSPAFRRLLQLPDDDLGARVDSLLAVPATQKLLKPDDVILRIGEYKISSDNTILYRGNRLQAALAFQLAQSGDTVSLGVWRDGKPVEVPLPVQIYTADLAAGNQYGTPPRYFIYAGLIFTPLSLDYLRTLGRDWNAPSNAELIYELSYRRNESPETARPEPVVLSAVLPDAVNANLTARGHLLVDKVNGVRIEKIDDVIRAFETNTTGYHTLEFVPHGSFESLDRAAADRAHERILKTYSIPNDRRL